MDWIQSKDHKPVNGQTVWTEVSNVPVLGTAQINSSRFVVDCGSIKVINPEVWATYETVY